MRFSIRAFISATSGLHISAAHRDTQPRGCVMDPSPDSDDLGLNGVEVPARVVLRFGSMTLAVAYAAPVSVSPRYASSLLT
jgi:hypothetical protein